MFSQTIRYLLDRKGVKWCLIIHGVVSAAVLTPCILLVQERSRSMIVKDVGLPPFTRNLIMTCGWGAASLAAFFISVFSLASYATDGLGLSQTQAAALQSVLSVGLTLGRPLWGALSDRFGRLYVPAICYLIAGLSTFAIWLPARSFGVLVAFACVQGLVAGVVWSTATPVLASAVEYRQLEGGLTVFWTAMTFAILVRSADRNLADRHVKESPRADRGSCVLY